MVLCVATAVASCRESTERDGSPQAAQASASSAEEQGGAHNADDVNVARTMLAIDRQTIQLSSMAPTRTTRSELISLAAQISTEQQARNQAFSAWLLQWGEDPHAGGGPLYTGRGSIDQATVGTLQNVHGAAFDMPWLQSMISLDKAAVEVGRTQIEHGRNPDQTTLVKTITTGNRTEIVAMTRMLEE
ncbi:DUF305 domain-containing protein [Mycobacterium sp.]|uniref:DUF305 domain-containing protein n=1 Tax=Mycobacterium sp. TaxID=1785 RepID=UPI003D096A25